MTEPQLFGSSDGSATTATGASRLVVEADGGSRGNPGHAGYGALVRDPRTGEIVAEKAEYIGKASNNVAEYSGLVAGLELARDIDASASIHVKMDSKLVVEQMSGRWQIKHADMRVLAAKARKVLDPRRVTYEWIPRERNKDADRLSNEAMDAGMAGVPWTPKRQAAPSRSASVEATSDAAPDVPQPRRAGRLHHVEVWTNDLPATRESLGWLLERLGFPVKDTWQHGVSYGSDEFYIVVEAGPDVRGAPDRRRPGVNHLAFHAGGRDDVDLLARRAASHGWSLLSTDAHPVAGGADHYAAYLENAEGLEVELVAT